MRMMHFIKNHFQRYRQRTPWDFCWRIGIESTAVSFVVAILLSVLGAPEREFPDWSMGAMFVMIVLFAPVFETLLMQALPIYIARKLRTSFRTQVIIATTVFALCHLAEGVAAIIAAGIIGGFYFSFAYAHWRSLSRWQAFWVTAGSHAIHNSIAFLAMLTIGF
jgi:hypothetical protein